MRPNESAGEEGTDGEERGPETELSLMVIQFEQRRRTHKGA